MILLLCHGHPTIARHAHPNLGRLIQPRHFSSIEKTSEAGYRWAADNDAYGNFDDLAFRKMLNRIWGLKGCLFVAAPDVVGDAEKTLTHFEWWYDELNATLQPLALVAQDGLTADRVPWKRIDALFIGGTTNWKLGAEAEALARESRIRDKWVHMGRVNTAERFRYAKAIGCNSIDGTKFSRWTRAWLADGIGMASAPPHLRMEVS